MLFDKSKIPNVTRGPFIRQNMLHVRRYSKTLKGIFGSFDLGIQEGIVNTFMRFIHSNVI